MKNKEKKIITDKLETFIDYIDDIVFDNHRVSSAQEKATEYIDDLINLITDESEEDIEDEDEEDDE